MTGKAPIVNEFSTSTQPNSTRLRRVGAALGDLGDWTGRQQSGQVNNRSVRSSESGRQPETNLYRPLRMPSRCVVDMEPVTPQAILNLYARLPDADVDLLLHGLGQCSTAEALQVIIRGMPPTEQSRLMPLFVRPLVDAAMPRLIQAAVRISREHQVLPDDEVNALVAAEADRVMEAATHLVREQERARLKAARDPKPRNTERDDEIVRLHDQEGRTFGQIPRLLVRKNPSWAAKDGEPMSRDAVEKAYHRRKRPGT